MTEARRGADSLVDALVTAGVEVIFGVPGDTGVAFYDALARRQDRIRHVLARDERSAAVMADGYARVSHRVGVVEASSGGGATFLVGGLGEPYAASVPLLVLTSDIHRKSRGSGAITEIDQRALFAAVTKAQWVVDGADDMAPAVRRALAVATGGRPGPVSVIVPEDVWDETAAPDTRPVEELDHDPGVKGGSEDTEALEQAARLLTRAYQPALLLGSGVHLSRTWPVVQALAERLGAGVATTIHGKGSFPETHPQSLGVVGANGARAYANEFLHTADVVLMVGTRANATDTDGFQSPPRTGCAVIHLDIDPARAGHNYPGSIPLVGDARKILPALLDRLPEGPRERSMRVRAWIAAERRRWEDRREPAPARGVDPRLVVEVLQRAYGSGAIVVGEPGTPTPYLASYWVSEGGRREVVLPRGHGAMGFAVPAAVGAALAAPDRPVIALTTDGSFGMAGAELSTVARLRLPILVVHLRNGSLGWIKALQHFYLDRRYFGVDLPPVDAAQAAEAYGVPAVEAATLAAFEAAVRRARSGEVPLFVDVPVPEEFEHLPPVAPWAARLAGHGTRPVY
jgi:acetolactate synthase-1/2/3 large subunit